MVVSSVSRENSCKFLGDKDKQFVNCKEQTVKLKDLKHSKNPRIANLAIAKTSCNQVLDDKEHNMAVMWQMIHIFGKITKKDHTSWSKGEQVFKNS